MTGCSSAPLSGKTIAVTRPIHQASSFSQKIEALGGTVLLVPAIRLRTGGAEEALLSAVKNLETFDWVIFTSVNGVRAFDEAMAEAGVARSVLATRQVAAIGPATARSLEDVQVSPDVVPDEFIADAIPDLLGEVSGMSILLPRADIARKDLSNILKQRGAKVTEIAAYEVELNDDPALIQKLRDLPEQQKPDYLTFTSSSTVRGFSELLRKADKESWLAQIPIVSIGPITAQTVRELSGKGSIVAREYTTDGVLQAIVEHGEEQSPKVAEAI
ncbi:MAG: uroporphyrinogen-III synthase [Bdellovibrionales bacterium]|nr:uroporphyrinogen-III synthase [Bdellovibrionales bacterium]